MKPAVQFLALIISLMGIVFLASAHFGFSSILQLPPSTWPIPYLTSECFLLSGIALSLSFSRAMLSKAIGLLVFLLAFQRTGELLLSHNSCVYSICSSFHVDIANSSKMVLPAAIGFMLIGITIALWPTKNRFLLQHVLPIFIASLIVFIGAFGIFTSLLPLQKSQHLHGMVIHFYTAVGFLMLGLGFIFAKFPKIESSV